MAHIPIPLNVGAFGPEERSDAIIQALVDNNPQMIQAVKERRNDQNIQVTSLTYRSQLVAGNNYVVKVRTLGDDYSYLLLKIFLPLPIKGKEQPAVLQGLQVIEPIDA